MDDSVIVLDDSVVIVEDDVEDGELEDDVIWVPESATTTNDDNKPVATEKAARNDEIESNPSSQENNQEEGETLVFEVRFSKEERFAGIQKQMLQLLEDTFADKQLAFKTNDDEGVIRAFERSEFPVERSPSPAVDAEDLFMIDLKPAAKLNASQVPSYKRSADVLDEQTEARKKLKAEAVNKCFRPKVQSACFNCGDTDHSIRECPKPRNNARIQRARKRKVERYHVDPEQRFGHIKPGRISTKTRHAIGYARGELPFMYYRLRVLGYPPAWLEEAKVQSSGIALFNADVSGPHYHIRELKNCFNYQLFFQGTEVTKSDDEDGEADTFKYDINKIVEFPGFNVEPSGKFFDDFQHHNVPPFQPENSKANFIKSLGENVTSGYKRKKLVDLPPTHDEVPVERTSFGDCDMEIVDEAEDPPLPASLPPPPPPPPESTEEEDGQIRSPSPTLDDLREQQEKLLLQLECNSSLNDSTSLNNLDDTAEKEATDKPQTQSAPATPTGTRASPLPAAKKFKASFEGTPVLKFSAFDKLPEGSNFKVGISDVINFENLPDSTGKYEQMKDLLKNVREKMVKLQSED
ncbi:hypothetical protein KR054_002543 [Drosophila jambulina]|nr:hypothetical protein KR054_002543 [Drosophila jambulina]